MQTSVGMFDVYEGYVAAAGRGMYQPGEHGPCMHTQAHAPVHVAVQEVEEE